MFTPVSKCSLLNGSRPPGANYLAGSWRLDVDAGVHADAADAADRLGRERGGMASRSLLACEECDGLTGSNVDEEK